MIKTSNGITTLGNQYQFAMSKDNQIGKGSYAKVMKGIQLSTNKIVAIKICAKQRMDEQQSISLDKQIHIMKRIQHPNIVDFYGVYQDQKNIYIVLQYLEGGELFQHILQKQYYCEQEAKKTLLPIIDAVRYLHKKGIIHRDLKPENIVYTEKSGLPVVKIIDFGVSQIITNQTVMSTAIGTPLYMAPQIFMGQKYRGAVDVWSIGVILYVLLCGYPPFQGQSAQVLQKQIKTSQITFYENDWAEVSDVAKDLVKQMLQRDPAKRITIDDIFKHPWIQEQASKINLQKAKIRLQNAFVKIINYVKVIRFMSKKE